MLQMSLFEFVGDITEESYGKFSDDVLENLNNYLQRGDKILTLLRKKKRRVFAPSDLLEAINYKAYSSKGLYDKKKYITSIAKKVLRSKWKKAYENNQYEKFFHDIGIYDVSLSLLNSNDEPSRLLEEMTKKKGYLGGIKISYGNNEMYAPIGDVYLTSRQSGNVWYFRRSKNKYRVCDVTQYFIEPFIYHSLRNRIQVEIAELTEQQLSDNKIVDFISNWISDIFLTCRNKNGSIEFKKEVLDIPYIKDYVQKYNIPVNLSRGYSAVALNDTLPFWLMYDSHSIFDNRYGLSTSVIELIDLIYDNYLTDKQTEKFLTDLEKEYAKVYETKKNIPEKVLKAMSSSSFNDYFGYVEFDEDCNLDSIKEIEKEFKALQETIFKQKDKKEDISLRFRKLGQHKATGLYFPALKCICVDVRFPSSFAHEYGHMLDFENGCVSRGVKFSKVLTIYKEIIEEFVNKLPEDDPLRYRLEGNTKFNKAYYLEPTEVFARSLEIYLVRCMKIDNSLVKPEGGFAYPDDERLVNAINEYFNEFFSVKTTAAMEAPAAKVAASY